jgi:tryprostatin B 6-hydroxylase
VLGASLLAGLFTSMITYRLFFHPLKSFAGPIGARVSAFWITKQNIPDMTFYRKLPKLHDQYGDFVRIRELLSVIVCTSTFADQEIRSA